MSYILDALKKADAQRERDPARGIHAQPAALPTLPQPGLGQRPWFWAAAAAAIAALVAAGWFLSQERADAQRTAAAASDLEAPRHPAVPAAAPAPLGAAVPAPEVPATAVLPPPAPVPVPVSPPAVAAPQARTIAPPAETAARVASPAKAGPAGTTPPAAAPQPPAAAAPAAVPAPAAPPQAAAPAVPAAPTEAPIANGLPADAPKLAISGGVYSANRAQRMLIVNGQVVNEGADLGGGIVLEEIRPKAAVLRFRGGRYSVAF